MEADYRVIKPPYPLNFREMSREQAKEYFDWFKSQIPIRNEKLAKYVQSTPDFQEWKDNFTPQSLDNLGKWFYNHVEIRKRSKEEILAIYSNSPDWFSNIDIPDYDLSSASISLAIDVGMYLSRVMEMNVPELNWIMVTRPKKDVDYQQPVLSGQGYQVFNPVRIVLTYAYGIARKSKGPERLRELYEIWLNILKGQE
jgi:hypothetical protein